MTSRTPIALLVLLALCLPAGAQEPTETTAAAAELAGVRAALEEIVELLRLQAASRDEELRLARLELAVATLDLRTRTAEAIEQKAGEVRQRLEAAETELFRMESTLEAVREEAAQAEGAGDPEREANIRRVQAQLEANVGLLEERISELEVQALDLDNELARARREVEDLEARVAEALGLD